MRKSLASKVKLLAWHIIRKVGFSPLILRWHPKSMLKNAGWFRSFRENTPVTIDGKPLPWLSYPFIHFIEPRLTKEMRVFEYGCGYSTIWFAQRVKEISSVEHDIKWVENINNQLTENASIQCQTDQSNYIKEVLNHGIFDIILIDGIHRNDCISYALKALSKNGVIIFDNSDRDEYIEAYKVLHDSGFRNIPFFGLAPSIFLQTQTSIFYKDNNCLNI